MAQNVGAINVKWHLKDANRTRLEAENAALQAKTLALESDAAANAAERDQQQLQRAAELEETVKNTVALELEKKKSELDLMFQEKILALEKQAASVASQKEASETATVGGGEQPEKQATEVIADKQNAELKKASKELEQEQAAQLEKVSKELEKEQAAQKAKKEELECAESDKAAAIQLQVDAVKRAEKAEGKLQALQKVTSRDWSVNMSSQNDTSPRKDIQKRRIIVKAVASKLEERRLLIAQVQKLIPERNKIIRQIMFATEKANVSHNKTPRLAERFVQPYWEIVYELNTLLASLDSINKASLVVRLEWELQGEETNEIREIEVLRQGKVCQVLPPDANHCIVEVDASVAASSFEVHMTMSSGEEILVGTTDVEHGFAEDMVPRHACIPGECTYTELDKKKSNLDLCSFVKATAKEEQFLRKIEGKRSATQKLMERFIHLGAQFPKPAEEFGRWHLLGVFRACIFIFVGGASA